MRQVKLVVHECYAGKRKSEEVNAAVLCQMLPHWLKVSPSGVATLPPLLPGKRAQFPSLRKLRSFSKSGNTTGTTLTGTNTSQKITSSAAYDSTGNYITSQTDTRGNTVTYTYGNAVSKMTGQPTAVTDPTNVTRTSGYNTANGRITGTEIAGTASLD